MRLLSLAALLSTVVVVVVGQRQCRRDELTPYFERYQSELGDALKCCNKWVVPPAENSRCGRRERTCLWGQQKGCDDLVEPTTRCDCQDRTWSCQSIEIDDCGATAGECCDPILKPNNFDCGLSGCTCCEDGQWYIGNSGPSITPEEFCKRRDLEASKPCPQCCDPADKPDGASCGRSGCTCCEDGIWYTGNSGPSITPEEFCKLRDLEASKPCPQCCDPADKPDDPTCGRSGCTCCEDGIWYTGNSGPTVTPEEFCKRIDMEPAKPCEEPQCCNPADKPDDFSCGLSGCTCCADGLWYPGNSGPTITPEAFCKDRKLEASKPCVEPKCCDPADLLIDLNCGFSGCTCCEDGVWYPGNSGPSVTPEEFCKRIDMKPSKPCEEPQCCDPAIKPAAVFCGRSGCTCCEDGTWRVGNSGPTITPEEFCKRHDMEASEPCPTCCSEKRPTAMECGRSGCHCCSDGEWLLGNSGPTLDSETACGYVKLEASQPCEPCCSEPKPSDAACGRSGCTCCSDGNWMIGNSGPTLAADAVCKGRDLVPAKAC